MKPYGMIKVMQEKIKRLLNENDRFAKHNNIKLTEVGEGYAVAEMEVNNNHLNAADVVQGGAIFTLADLAFGAASNSYGVLNLNINSSISFVKSVKSGKLTAYAKEISKNKKISVYQIEVKNQKGELIATMQGVAYSKGKIIE